VALTEWQILDEQYNTVVEGNDYIVNDSVNFTLDGNKQYFLKISVYEVYNAYTSLYTLRLDGEPVIFINSDITTGDHLFPFFTGTRTKDVRITGGKDAVISDFPWQVAYYISDRFECGGSIINGKWVVTAAHCAKNNDGSLVSASSISIKVGANNPYNNLEGKKYFVSEVIVHEGYNSISLENDIALLRIKDSINFPNAVPVKLLTAKDENDGAANPGVMSWVTGWGLTRVNPDVMPIALQKVQLPIVSNSQAAVVWGPIPSTDIMAGYRNGNIDACNGDSGGPLVVPVLGEYKLAGIVSWGSTNCNSYGAYTRVSLFNDWISTKTGIPKLYVPSAPVGDSVVCQGIESTQYSIAAQPSATAYEWRLYPSDAGVISGNATNASVLWNISKTGSVAVMVRVTIDRVVSDWSKINVNIVRNTRLLSQSGDTSICAVQPVKLSVNADGYKLVYNWYQNSAIVQTGTSNQLVYSNAATGNSGIYRCEVTGSCGTVVSGNINLTVHPLTSITFISPDTQVPFGNDVTLEVNSEGHDLMYQWEKDGAFLINSTNSRFVLQNVNATDIGLYQVVVKGTCGTKVSDPVYLYVRRDNNLNLPEVFVWPTVTNSFVNVAISSDDAYSILLFNISGQLMKDIPNCRYQTTLDLSTMARGVYIINVFNKNFRKAVKVIKE
jgi:secreted trypsin-like serine protease